MKTQLISTVLLLASSPAGASINASIQTALDITPRPAVFQNKPATEAKPACGQARQMLFILRDPSGAVVAMGVANIAPSC